VDVTLILVLSVLLQFTAAILALRLIRVTGAGTAWVPIAAAVLLMAVRRSITLFRLLSGDLSRPPDLSAELVALVISILMVTGIAAIAPLFRTIQRSEEELRSSEEHYRTLFEQSRDAIYLTTTDGKIVDVNQSASDLLGYRQEELLGQQIQTLYADASDWTRLQEQMQQKGAVIDFELNLRRKDGAEIACMLTSSVRRAADGTITGYQGILRDVTERKKVEDAVRRAEARYRELFEEAPVMYVVSRNEGGTPIIADCNKIFLSTLGYSREEMLGRRLADFYTPESRAKLEQGGYQQALEGKFMAQERDFITKDGRIVPTLLRAIPERDADGRVYGTRAMYVDITDRKRAEQALRESEERYRSIIDDVLDSSAVGMFVLDAEFKVVWLNRAMERYFGLRRETVICKDKRRLIREQIQGIFERPEEFAQRVLATYDDNTYIEDFECHVLPEGDREERWLEHHSQPIRSGLYAGGRIEHYYDITERKRAEEALRRSEEQLRQSQKMEAIGRLAGGIAHDFNNLLTAIMGYSEFFLNELDPDDQRRRLVQEIHKTAERAASLTGQLLAFSRKQVLQPRVLDLNAVLSGIEKMLRRLIGEDIDLITRFAPDLGTVKVDPGQIEQVILNLAVNARDAMPRGGKLTIETANVNLDEDYARRHVGVTPGAYVMLAVSDTGSGMDPETQSRIFEPFFTTKTHGGGTGLGLATVYGIVKQSGGHIWVYSEPGRGSTFKIYFPRVEEAADELKPRSAFAQPTQGSETILLVEDEEIVREVAERILVYQGYKVLVARDANDALRLCETHEGPIHLMVTDVVMPQMSGRALAEQVVHLRPETKVLYVSGYTDNAIVHHGVLEEGTAFLGKPFTPDALAKKVREVLDSPEEA
jgi:PAS domain S-box-containing protein